MGEKKLIDVNKLLEDMNNYRVDIEVNGLDSEEEKLRKISQAVHDHAIECINKQPTISLNSDNSGDYIRRQDVFDAIWKVDPENDGSDGCTIVLKNIDMTSAEVESIVDGIPAADVRPIVRARWIYKGLDKGWECSNCRSRCLLNYESDFFNSAYCPHCGAYMVEGDVTCENSGN